jgi:transcriptional regulator with XRE-family HTH domain
VTEQSSVSFAGLLRQLRGQAKLTREELAEAAGLSPRAVSDLERGIHRTAHKDTAMLLAAALGMAESAGVVFAEAARGRTPAVDVLAAMRRDGQRLAGVMPRLWNIPARNLAFTGREDLLAAVRDRLQAGHSAVVQALHGMGGVGKTQLAAGIAAGQYLGLLQTRAGQLLDRGAPGSYPRSLAAATALIADRLVDHDPAAAELASLCAFLAPEPTPEDLFTGAAGLLPGKLAARAGDPLAWRQTLAHMARQSLARIDHRGLQMHRLTQAILRDRLTPARASAARTCTEAILAVSDPGDPPNPDTWTRWARLMPHVLAADLAGTDCPALRELVRRMCWYLIERGDSRTRRHRCHGHKVSARLL